MSEKSNEITAVPLLLYKIDISGKIITADAMSMQKDIIEKIRKKGGDFLIELKANQRLLCAMGWKTGSKDSLRCIPILMVLSSVMGESRQEHITSTCWMN